MDDFKAIVLAAGRSARMGGPNKLLAPWRGAPLARYPIAAACGSRAAQVALTVARDAEAVAALHPHAKLHAVAPPPGADMAQSLQAGLAAVAPARAVAVLLADMPGITASLLDQLFAAWDDAAYALVPACAGAWGNPVLLGPAAVADAASLSGDRGARRLLEAAQARVRVLELNDPAILADLDRPEDFLSWCG